MSGQLFERTWPRPGGKCNGGPGGDDFEEGAVRDPRFGPPGEKGRVLGSGSTEGAGGTWPATREQRAHPQGSSFRPEHCPRTGNGGGSAESSGKTARLSPCTQTGCRLRTRWWCVSQPGAKSWGPRSCKAPLGDPGTATCAPAATSGTATPDRPRAALRSRAGDSAALDCGARSAQLYARGVGRAGGKGSRAGFWSAGS